MTASTPCSAMIVAHQHPVGDFALNEDGVFADLRAPPGRKIVEHDHLVAAIQQRVCRVAADIAGATGDQDRHAGILQPANLVKIA